MEVALTGYIPSNDGAETLLVSAPLLAELSQQSKTGHLLDPSAMSGISRVYVMSNCVDFCACLIKEIRAG